jgi:hypothetical protein
MLMDQERLLNLKILNQLLLMLLVYFTLGIVIIIKSEKLLKLCTNWYPAGKAGIHTVTLELMMGLGYCAANFYDYGNDRTPPTITSFSPLTGDVG